MKRIAAIDVMRGLTIVMMIVVNNPGSWSTVYWPLLHAHWHGMTPTDLVFPFFIFIMGVSAAISHNRQSQLGVTKREQLKGIVRRSVILFALGLFLAVFYYNPLSADYHWFDEQIRHIRIMGVLQRLGLVYLIAASALVLFGAHRQPLVLIACIVGYWALMNGVTYADAEGNPYVGQWHFGNSLSAWLDNAVFGSQHVYYPQATPFAFDPEGLLSTLPAVGSCVFGILTGQWLIHQTMTRNRAFQLGVFGGITAIAGLMMSLWVPLNKALWSPSYTVVSAGLAMMLLALLCILLAKKADSWWSYPFTVAGANSIVIFMLSGIFARLLLMIPVGDITLKGWVYSHVFRALFTPYHASFAFALAFLLLCYVPVQMLYNRKIFVRI